MDCYKYKQRYETDGHVNVLKPGGSKFKLTPIQVWQLKQTALRNPFYTNEQLTIQIDGFPVLSSATVSRYLKTQGISSRFRARNIGQNRLARS